MLKARGQAVLASLAIGIPAETFQGGAADHGAVEDGLAVLQPSEEPLAGSELCCVIAENVCVVIGFAIFRTQPARDAHIRLVHHVGAPSAMIHPKQFRLDAEQRAVQARELWNAQSAGRPDRISARLAVAPRFALFSRRTVPE
jgi:hypothetical protein